MTPNLMDWDPEEPDETGKKGTHYSRPRLIRYGSVKDLTSAGPTSVAEGSQPCINQGRPENECRD